MRFIVSLFGVCAVLLIQAPSGGADQKADLTAELQSSLAKLSEQRAVEAEEKPLLGKQVAECERQLITLRRKHRLSQLGDEGRKAELRDLTLKSQSYEKDQEYMQSLYRDFAIQLGTQLQPGQKGLYGKSIDETILSTTGIERRSQIVDLAMDRLESMLGGEMIDGEIISDDGHVVSGRVVNIGSATWFRSNDGKVAGPVLQGKGAALPRLMEGNKESVDRLFNGEPAQLLIDFTGGKARAIAQIQGNSTSQLFKKGGIWLWPIIAIALVSALCGVMKMIQLGKIKNPSGTWVAEILDAVRAGDMAAASARASGVKHPIAPILTKSFDYVSAGADVVEEVIYEQLIGVQDKLQRWLPFIAVTAATAPLLGLLGTVSGMIRMFNVITVTGTGDVKPMAGGISEALVTTLFGLVVAIPALILHTMLSRRSNGVVQNTEKLGLTFVNGLRKMK